MSECKCGHPRSDHFAMKTARRGPDHSPAVVGWGKCRMQDCDCSGYRLGRVLDEQTETGSHGPPEDDRRPAA